MKAGTNPYCDALEIGIPNLEVVKDNRDANYYGLLIVVLLERGEPVTLQEAAQRFEEVGVAPAAHALASLKRCKPGRAPIYRDGDLYALDPQDAEADLWVYRLGLRSSKAASHVDRPAPEPLPTVDAPLTVVHLDEVWRDGVPSGWSAQRVVLCILDAHGRAMDPEDVISFVSARSQWNPVPAQSANYWRRGSAIRAREDGCWELDPNHDALRAARQAVIDRIETRRRWASEQPDPAVVTANRIRFERERQARAEELGCMRRVLIHAFPVRKPEALVLVDVAERDLDTFVGDEIASAVETLAAYDIIAAIDVRTLLRTLRFEPGDRRLGELGPPQKTRTINKNDQSERTDTQDHDESVGAGLMRHQSPVRRREEDARVPRRRRADEAAASARSRRQVALRHLSIWAPAWHPAATLGISGGTPPGSMGAPRRGKALPPQGSVLPARRASRDRGWGSAPGWADPWSRLQVAHVEKEQDGWRSWLVDDYGSVIHEDEIQLARLSGSR